MDADHLQASAQRDQLWASLRALLPEIEAMAEGAFTGAERERQVAQLLARITVAELRFRAGESAD
ncbi:MAG: hypothetical protein U0797_22700 [Gemmataceae bacterium]